MGNSTFFAASSKFCGKRQIPRRGVKIRMPRNKLTVVPIGYITPVLYVLGISCSSNAVWSSRLPHGYSIH